MNVKEELKNYLCQTFTIESKALELDTNLLEGWITDSIHVLTIVNYLENKFKLSITPEDLDMEHFKTINKLSDFIMKKTAL